MFDSDTLIDSIYVIYEEKFYLLMREFEEWLIFKQSQFLVDSNVTNKKTIVAERPRKTDKIIYLLLGQLHSLLKTQIYFDV